jgi:hypothetical protein
MNIPLQSIITPGNPAVILARVYDENGNPIAQSSVSSISVSVVNAETTVQTSTASPAVGDCVYNSMQQDGRWTQDNIGFNLAVPIQSSSFNSGDTQYEVQITITPTSGDPYRIVAQITTLPGLCYHPIPEECSDSSDDKHWMH